MMNAMFSIGCEPERKRCLQYRYRSCRNLSTQAYPQESCTKRQNWPKNDHNLLSILNLTCTIRILFGTPHPILKNIHQKGVCSQEPNRQSIPNVLNGCCRPIFIVVDYWDLPLNGGTVCNCRVKRFIIEKRIVANFSSAFSILYEFKSSRTRRINDT
ncbi:hypothetical protein PENTCL1PPCAC_20969, partial [Pristionchus entomophagus]